ncbi:hypothetical protein Cgig2_021074 [Carnegiea gigantea]|uniref:Uncharacterized protein n=1 Tax=Carnegiea gigantea TaxID=171969 RepID=A0A9Q1Q4M9_9CARY|nr:hypothetical protein Cgig2_021074 [Carnegiea gigantea]
MENLLPLLFSEIFKISSLVPTTLKSNDLLSIAKNFLQPPLILSPPTGTTEKVTRKSLLEEDRKNATKSPTPAPQLDKLPLETLKTACSEGKTEESKFFDDFPIIGKVAGGRTSGGSSSGKDRRNPATLRSPEKSSAADSPVGAAPAKTEESGDHPDRGRWRKQPTNKRKSEKQEIWRLYGPRKSRRAPDLPVGRAPAETEKSSHHPIRERRRKRRTNNRRSEETIGRTRKEERAASAMSSCPPASRGEQTD